MYLPLRLAAILPIIVATVIGLGMGVFLSNLRRIHSIDDLLQIALMSFFTAATALIVVLPNLVAAYVANQTPNERWPIFIVTFIGVFSLVWLGQSLLLKRGLKGLGGFSGAFEVGTINLLLVNIAICLSAAFWVGRSHVA